MNEENDGQYRHEEENENTENDESEDEAIEDEDGAEDQENTNMDHDFLMTTDDDEALERAIRTLRRQIGDLEREDEELTRRSEEALSDELISTFRAAMLPEVLDSIGVFDSSGGARNMSFQPSPTAQALEWAKSTEFFPQELARLTARYGQAVVDEELEIFAFINTLHFYGRIPGPTSTPSKPPRGRPPKRGGRGGGSGSGMRL